MTTMTELNEQTIADLREIDTMLVLLARYEHAATRDTRRADIATHAINRIARRYGLTGDDDTN